ncbi:MAG: hypothetical protein FWE49_06075, partial [Synergistaceae bacterium]|nr:hypothetical protein [Synergistaceae bacterium]
MKKLIALFTIASFLIVSAGGAFAAPSGSLRERDGTNKIERRDDRRTITNRPQNRRLVNRPGLNRRHAVNRPVQRQSITRHSRPTNHHFSRNRPGNFFNRAARYPRYNNRPFTNYRPYNYSRNNSMTPLEFLGIGAMIISLAAIVSG